MEARWRSVWRLWYRRWGLNSRLVEVQTYKKDLLGGQAVNKDPKHSTFPSVTLFNMSTEIPKTMKALRAQKVGV